MKIRQKCHEKFGDEGVPEMDPAKFEFLCDEAGAGNIFPFLFNAMSFGRTSESRAQLNKIRTMVVIYMMIYGQSQKANWFQLALSRTLLQYGISHHGLASLRNLGIAAHPKTIKVASTSSSKAHMDTVNTFIQDAIQD